MKEVSGEDQEPDSCQANRGAEAPCICAPCPQRYCLEGGQRWCGRAAAAELRSDLLSEELLIEAKRLTLTSTLSQDPDEDGDVDVDTILDHAR